MDHPTSAARSSLTPRRTVVAGLAAVPLLIGTGAGTAAADPSAPAPATGDTELTLVTGEMTVTVATSFPRVVRYTHRKSGAVLHGQEDTVTTLVIDGTEVTASGVTCRRTGHSAVAYVLSFAGGGRIEAEIAADGAVVTFRVTRIVESPDFRVGTLEIPGLRMVSVRSDQAGATVRTALVDLDKSREGDTVITLSADTPADGARKGCAYAVLHTKELAAGIESNSVTDQISKVPGSSWENGRLWRLIERRDGYVKCSLASGQWTYRADQAKETDTEALPYVRVIITGDRNGDGVVDWQDGAIALRELLPRPLGADEQHLRVVPHIPYLNSSAAENTFLMLLDNVKRISLATDGLGQFTLVKGYQGEGHDCAHPDYAGHYNERAGGLAHLNELFHEGRKWNSHFAVHVNCTESYPEAHAFSEELVDKTWLGWDGKDQSYRIKARRDLTSGDNAARFRRLREEADAGLDMLYIDVFRESGWTSDRLQRELRAQGWVVTTEWGHGLERSAVWSHWANDVTYGGDSSRGINSTLARFLMNHYKDVFSNRAPLLPVPRVYDFETWQDRTNWNSFYAGIWENNLPAKYLQAYPVTTWADDRITFESGTEVSADADGKRVIVTDGRTVLHGDTYLLPWEPRNARDPERLYHFSKSGGVSKWELPRGWSGQSRVAVYRLTDQGRVFEDWAPVRRGVVTLRAEAGQPYTVYRHRAPMVPRPRWGQGSGLVNPFFNSGDLEGWRVEGAAQVRLSDRGHHEAHLGTDGLPASLGQRVTGLVPGASYTASVQVEIGAAAGEHRTVTVAVTTPLGRSENRLATSTLVNSQESDPKKGTRFMRVPVHFTAPDRGGDVIVELGVEAGAAQVRLAHVRVSPGGRPAKPGTLVYEDFEHVPYGMGPFVGCNIRSHLSELHAPFTQKGWNGKQIDDVLSGGWSLKSRATSKALQYRSIPCTVPFRAGKRYRVEFDYQSETSASWVTGVDEPASRILRADALPRTSSTTRWSYEFTAPESGEAWVGLRSDAANSTEIVIDQFAVTELD
ncbi:endo-alpha-N-acetylgalactosaminidase family protein [Streptomyces sp. NPDC056949]|uniref:endo-alpha-N-acetylgalactosaminidase family protein n=1 Tax=Streptomyces sp. NPDC056949 TaxID=3345976 RepID=UPI0036281798